MILCVECGRPHCEGEILKKKMKMKMKNGGWGRRKKERYHAFGASEEEGKVGEGVRL